MIYASSAGVYGSRNPYRHPERITPDTPVNPVDQYGEDKVLAEAVIRDSGLPYAMLRLAAVISPDAGETFNADHLLLMRATPGDNRMHTVDARDVALAFANAVDRADVINGKVLLIAGDETHLHAHRDLEDDIMEHVGIGRLGPSASLPVTPTTTEAGVSPVSSTPPSLRRCSRSSSTAGRTPLPGSPRRRAAAASCCGCSAR